MARDVQRSKLYAAERAVFSRSFGGTMGTPVTIAQAQDLHDRIWTSKLVAERFEFAKRWKVPKRIIAKLTHQRHSSAASFGGRINYGPGALLDWVVVHEMAHEVVPRSINHGWQFAAAYLYLVGRYIGRAEEAALKASFKKHKVRYTAPRAKRQLSDEQITALRERLAAARITKAATRTETGQ